MFLVFTSTSVGAGSPKATSELQKSCTVELSHNRTIELSIKWPELGILGPSFGAES